MGHESVDPREEEELLGHTAACDCQKKVRNGHRRVIYSLCLGILALCGVVWYLSTRTVKDPSQLIYSPAMEAVEYEVVDFEKVFLRRNEYMGLAGYPTDETDTLWLDLYYFTPAGIPRKQADLLVNRTEPIPGTEIYLVDLDVFHQLHCLDLLRKALYPDRYGQWVYKEDGTVDTLEMKFQHWEHCIDSLRQTLMCHGDIHPLQYRVNAGNGILASDLSTRHTCRNFDKLREWSKKRTAPEYEVHVAKGIIEIKPDFTFQDIVNTEVWREPTGGRDIPDLAFG